MRRIRIYTKREEEELHKLWETAFYTQDRELAKTVALRLDKSIFLDTERVSGWELIVNDGGEG